MPWSALHKSLPRQFFILTLCVAPLWTTAAAQPNPVPPNGAAGVDAALDLDRLGLELDQLFEDAKFHVGILRALRAVTQVEELHGRDDVRLIGFLRRLGEFQQSLGQFRDAEANYARSIAIADAKVKGPDLAVGLVLNCLAGLYQTLGRHSEAEPIYVKALAIFEPLKDKLQTAIALRDMAEMYRAQGRFAAAEPLYRRSLAMTTTLDKDAEHAITLNDFAGWHRDQARYAEAEALHTHARDMFKKKVGIDHPDFANATNDLAETFRAQGRHGEAEPLYLQARKIIDASLGAEHPTASLVRNNLGELYRALGRLSEAEAEFKQAIANFEKMAVPPQPDLATALNNLANLFRGQGRYGEADRLYARALEIRERTFGDRHLDIAATLGDRAGSFELQNRYADAAPDLMRALSITEAIVGPAHLFNKSILLNLATVFDRLGRTTEATSFRTRAAAIPGWDVMDVPVLFATNRVREPSTRVITFGANQQADPTNIAFGRATVRAPKTEVLNRAAREAQSFGRVSVVSGRQTNETVLAVQRVDVSTDKGASMFAEARDRLSRSTRFPRQAIIYVHGYNNSFEDAARRAAMIGYDLGFDGLVSTFAWPARSGVTAYLGDRDRAATAAPFLLEMLETLGTALPDVKVHVIGHSTGAEVILNALERLADRSITGQRVKLGEVIFAHADVNPTRLAAVMPSLRRLGIILTSYSSKADRAMSVSGWVRWDGARVGGAPVYLADVDAIDVSGLGSTFALNHNVFVQNPYVFGDMARLMAASVRPVDKRTPQISQKTTRQGTHWEFKKIVRQ